MKQLLLPIVLLFCFSLTTAQSSFYQGKLKQNDGTLQSIYIKNRRPVISSTGEVIIYQEPRLSSRKELLANEFSTLTISEPYHIELVSTAVTGISEDKIILRKLIDGDYSLLEFISDQKDKKYVVEKNGSYELLLPTKNGENSIEYREWLFKNLNPSGISSKEFSKLYYLKSSLVDYFQKNGGPSYNVMDREFVTNHFNLNFYVGYSNNSVILNDDVAVAYEDFNFSHVRIGAEVAYNLSRVRDNFALLLGLGYHFNQESNTSAVLNPTQAAPIEASTRLNLEYLAISLGLQYKIHASPKLKIMPFLSLEGQIPSSNSTLALTNERNGNLVFDNRSFAKGTVGINLGTKVSFNKFYAFVEFTDLINNINNEGFDTAVNSMVETTFTRTSFGVGYTIF